MHPSIFVFALLLGVAFPAVLIDNPLSDDFINKINEKQNSWRAGRNFDENTPLSEIKSLLGVLPQYKSRLPKKLTKVFDDLPENFDSRENWPKCASLNVVRDQSTCGSCWAFAAVEAMSDRICIHSNSTVQTTLSARDLTSCCYICGFGCNGGYPDMAWMYWKREGIVTGGPYGTSDGCQAYPFPSCEHHTTGDLPPCGPSEDTPECTKKCDKESSRVYENDVSYGKSVYNIDSDEAAIRAEIYENGPVEASFMVYEDFLNYKSGVYSHTSGSLAGGHAVKILGWGVENDLPYWLVANSWNKHWGDNGYFKILRGDSECGIEDDIVAGLPDFSKK